MVRWWESSTGVLDGGCFPCSVNSREMSSKHSSGVD